MPTSPKSIDGAPIAPSALPDLPGPAPATAEVARTIGHPAETAENQHPAEPTLPGVPLAPPGIAPESDVRVHSPSSAAPQPSHGHVNDGLGELPAGYGDARLVSLVRDPATLFVYWDFSQQQIDQAFHGLGPARAVLKLWNVRSAEHVRDSEVHLEARGWYVRDLPAGTELRAELWAVGERGSRMLRAARPVKLPPGVPSDQLDAFYIRIPLGHSLRDGLSTGRQMNYGGTAATEWDRRLQPRMFDTSSQHGGPYGSSPGAKLPWSMTHLIPDLDGDT